jgi:hypothetical protein
MTQATDKTVGRGTPVTGSGNGGGKPNSGVHVITTKHLLFVQKPVVIPIVFPLPHQLIAPTRASLLVMTQATDKRVGVGTPVTGLMRKKRQSLCIQ